MYLVSLVKIVSYKNRKITFIVSEQTLVLKVQQN